MLIFPILLFFIDLKKNLNKNSILLSINNFHFYFEKTSFILLYSLKKDYPTIFNN